MFIRAGDSEMKEGLRIKEATGENLCLAALAEKMKLVIEVSSGKKVGPGCSRFRGQTSDKLLLSMLPCLQVSPGWPLGF